MTLWTLMFEPSGLFFYEVATLTIATPEEMPIGEQFAFTFDDEGSAFRAAPMVVDSATPTVLVGHLGGKRQPAPLGAGPSQSIADLLTHAKLIREPTTYTVDAVWGDFALSGPNCEPGEPFHLDAVDS